MQSENLIDDTANFNGAPVYIFSGNNDTFYPQVYQEAQRDYYNNFNANVEYVTLDVGHEIPSIFASNQILNPSNTAYDVSGLMFQHLMSNLPSNSIPTSEWAQGDIDWW